MCDLCQTLFGSLAGVLSVGAMGIVVGLILGLWFGICASGARSRPLSKIRYGISPDPRPNRWKVEHSP